LLIFIRVVFEGEDFKATSSSLLLLLIEGVIVNNIMTNIGTNKSRNGDTFDNFFIIVLF